MLNVTRSFYYVWNYIANELIRRNFIVWPSADNHRLRYHVNSE